LQRKQLAAHAAHPVFFVMIRFFNFPHVDLLLKADDTPGSMANCSECQTGRHEINEPQVWQM